jgi:hypothetical protein
MPSIAANLPAKTGYTFGGYYKNEAGAGNQYYNASGASARNSDFTAAGSLYAKWTQTVTLNANTANGGSGSNTSATATFNGTALTYMNTGSLPYYNVAADAPSQNIVDQTVTDYWLERGDYVNIDYLTMGWNIPVKRVVRSLRLSLSVNNLATITGYSGLTPMINSSVTGSTFGLDDKISYPVYRSYSVSASIQF